MSAIRLARGFTGRSKVVKFAGCYHGHVDALLASAGSGLATFALPDSPGVTGASAGRHDRRCRTTTSPRSRPPSPSTATQIACVITEAAPGNMGVVPPQPGFTEALRRVTRAHGALLISDEVMTGFRCSRRRLVRPRGPVRRGPGRPVHLRQGHGRRLPGGGVRRPGRRHGPCSRRTGRSTRRARCPGTRSPPRRAWRRCSACTPRSTTGSAWSRRPSPGARRRRCGRGRRAARRPARRQHVQRLLPRRRGPRLRRRESPGRRGVHGASSTRCCSQGVHLPPSAFEAWFVSAAHDDAAVDRVLGALPAAARAVTDSFATLGS